MLVFALLIATVAQDRASTGPVSDNEAPPVASRSGCGTAPDEITVCGDVDPARFRARPLAPRYRRPPLRPRFTLPGGGTGTVEAVQRAVGGVSVPAAMLTLRIPLGGAKKKYPLSSPPDPVPQRHP